MADFSSNQDKAAEIFSRAFKDCASNIIKSLPHDPDSSDATTANAVFTIAAQLSFDFARLAYVIEVIQARVYDDPAWATTAAVNVYELLAMAIDPEFSHPDGQMQALKGPALVRDQMMRTCQIQFQRMVEGPAWSRGLLAFLAQLCTTYSITSATPGIILHIIDGMVDSPFCTYNDNFDLLVEFVSLAAGPFVDSQAECQQQLTVRLLRLQQRTKLFRMSSRLAVYGVLRLRERGWRTEELNGPARDE